MKNSILLLFSSILLSINVSAQQYNEKVASYYQYKNKAELAIIDSNYEEANQFYEKAFAQKFPFAPDLNNAFIAAYLTIDTILAQKYYNSLVLHGWEKENMEGSKYFFENIVKQPFYIYLSRNYDSLWNIAINSRMPLRGKEINNISDTDQAVRKNKNKLNNEEYYKQLKAGDTKAIALLKQYIKKYGFPNFDQVGFFDNLGGHPFSPCTSFFLHWHQRGANNILDSLFHEEVMNGNFMADKYAITADRTKERYYMVLPEFKNLDSIQIKTKLAVINKERAKIYLESIEDYSRKLIFQEKNRQFYFVNFITFAFNMPAQPSNRKD